MVLECRVSMKNRTLFLLYSFTLLWLFGGHTHVYALCTGMPTSSTVFKPPSVSTSLSLETALHTLKVGYRAESPVGGGKKPKIYTDWSIFYFRSFNARAQAASYLPGNNVSIVVGQDNGSNISSGWFGVLSLLNTQYKSTTTMLPLREIVGGTFKILADFGAIFEESDTALKDMWTSYYLPVTHLRHNLNLTEELQGGPGLEPGFETFLQAANNLNWYKFGRLAPNVQKATAVDDMQWRVGWNFQKNKNIMNCLYFVLFIPAGIKATARTLFEPIIGNGGHWAPGCGLSGSWTFWQIPEARASLVWELRWNYIIGSTERRTFDLINGDWSRYLLIASPNRLTDPVPGINFLTRDIQVIPRNTVDFVLATNYTRDQLSFELGYDLWWRQLERVILTATNQPLAFALPLFVASTRPGEPIQAVIYDLYGCCPKTSISDAVICISVPDQGFMPPSNNTPVIITNQSINVASATKPGTMFMKLYGGFAYTSKTQNETIGAAASVEFNGPANALKQWGVWLKAAYSF